MRIKNSKKVFVALSGGVDSSVAALLLKKQGFALTGVFMKCFNLDGCAEKDAEDARRVASHLRIPFYVFDFEKEYKKRVVKYMIQGYKKGITPNPDVMCNKTIKFDLFLKQALKMGADYIATGHYICLRQKFSIFNFQFSNKSQKSNSKKEKIYSLYQAKDKNKDQSYFLWTLTQEQLRYCLFPIGDYLKSEVRVIAKKAGLLTAEKKDSQGICFLGKVSLKNFLEQYIPIKKGDIKDTKGRKIGEHNGAWFYTIGERHGLNLGIKNKELGIRGKCKTQPHYVVAKDIRTNILIVAERENNMVLYKSEIQLTDVNFINPLNYLRIKNKELGIKVLVRIRYRQPLFPALLYELKVYPPTKDFSGRARGSDFHKENRESSIPINRNRDYKLIFISSQKFIAPGQSAVFYSQKGEMLGGGIII